MLTMTTTVADVQHDFQKFVSVMRDGYEITLTENGKEIGKFIPLKKSKTPITDSLIGFFHEDLSLDDEREKYLRGKYELID